MYFRAGKQSKQKNLNVLQCASEASQIFQINLLYLIEADQAIFFSKSTCSIQSNIKVLCCRQAKQAQNLR